MRNGYEAWVRSLVRLMYYIAGVAILGMMLLTCADTTLRFFRRPIQGTYELVSFMGALAVSFAIAHTAVEKGHVAVSFLVNSLPARIQPVIRTMTDFLSLLLFAAISWQSFLYGSDLRASGELSATIQIPFYPVVYGIGFATGTVCLVLLMDGWNNLRKAAGR